MRWIPLSLVLPLSLIVSGCGGTAAVQTANGGGYRVTCGGPFSSKLDCNKQANRMCPSGFEPITSPVGELVFTCSKRPIPAQAPMDQ